MEVKQVVVVGVIKQNLFVVFCLFSALLSAQKIDSLSQFKKKVLESIEVDMLMSYYQQKGIHAAVTGGIGNEYLTDYTPTLVVRIPIKEDAVLTADVGLSAYTSASSSNGNPFNKSGASGGGYENDDDDHDDDEYEYGRGSGNGTSQGSPWVASTGASRKDVLTTVNLGYQQASDDRNLYWGVSLGGSAEYDYESLNLGLNFARLWNEQNTELSLKSQVFIDRWKPVIPTELHEYEIFGNSFLINNQSYFSGVSIIDENGNSVASYLPSAYVPFTSTRRNSFALSLGFTQILSPYLQASIFADYIIQKGVLANPLQRVYFGDLPNYYIGNFNSIANYTSRSNTDVFHLADDIERLPSNRTKIPLGIRLNYYLNDAVVIRSYFRYYQDDWGIDSNTFQVEIPIRLNLSWKLTPTYRFYDQTEANYFAPYNQNLSTDAFYTSDYDLSGFSSHQWGLGLTYRSVFNTPSIFNFDLKTVQFRAQNYSRSDGLSAFIISTALQFVLN